MCRWSQRRDEGRHSKPDMHACARPRCAGIRDLRPTAHALVELRPWSGRLGRARTPVETPRPPSQRTAHRLSGRADGRRPGERRFLPAALAVTPSPSRTAAPTGAPLRSAWVTPRRPHAPTGDDARGFEAAHRGSGGVGGWLFGIAAMATPRATAADGTARRQPKVVTAPPAPGFNPPTAKSRGQPEKSRWQGLT